MSSIKPIKVWGKRGPNPPKIAMLCEELGLPHEIVDTSFEDLKKPDYLAVNPNGRMPAIQDPNTGFTIWESGAIIEYLIEKYDVDHKFSFPQGRLESYLTKQWLYYQVSGQGPYYGQGTWFTKFHHEDIPSAKERYYKEIKRVTSVLDGHLKKQEKGADGPWLVGNKFTFADLAFIPWQNLVASYLPMVDVSEYTEAAGWLERMKSRPAIAKVLEAAKY